MELLATLLVLLLVTRAFGEVSSRLGQPPLLGELIGGISLGVLATLLADELPSLDGITEDEVFLAIADLGIFFLMLLAGIELGVSDVQKSSGRSAAVAVGGFLVPLAVGVGGAWLLLPDSDFRLAQAVFVGTALAITAVPTSIRLLMDLGALQSRIGRTIVSAAIFDDILSLFLLAFLTGLIREGDLPGATDLLLLLGKIAAFFALTVILARGIMPRLRSAPLRLRSPEQEFSILLAGAFGFALLADLLDLHFIVGAFAAGLLFEGEVVGKDVHEAVSERVSGITHGFLGPIFFASIGLQFEVGALTAIPAILVLLIAVAFATKLLGAGVAAYLMQLPLREAAAVGFGMSARGAVELIVADVALQAGLFRHPADPPPIVEHLFSAVVLMALVTTVITPIALNLLVRRRRSRERPAPARGDGG